MNAYGGIAGVNILKLDFKNVSGYNLHNFFSDYDSYIKYNFKCHHKLFIWNTKTKWYDVSEFICFMIKQVKYLQVL